MTLKDEFLNISTYKEYDRKRDRFRTLKIDNEVKEHLSALLGKNKNKFTGIIIESKSDGDKPGTDDFARQIDVGIKRQKL